jgi:Fe-S cluster biogenesis protein NfuA
MTDQNANIDIRLEFTPNPNTLKFVTNRTFLERGAANFPQASFADGSALPEALFKVPGIEGVMVGTHFVTITKGAEGEWDVIAEEVPKTIQAHLESGKTAIDESKFLQPAPTSENASEIELKIREVLDTEIRPAVAMDGGDIVFSKYEEGIVYLHLQGSCSSCPSSVATLKMGVESRLKDVIPEIKEVVQV